MSTLAGIERATRIPSDDIRPLEHAVVTSLTADTEPETWLAVVFTQPDGGLRVRWGWTRGGVELGNHIDELALATGLDIADNFHLCDLHKRVTFRGRVRVEAHPLRPILADVAAGIRCPKDRWDGLHRVLEFAAAERNQPTPEGLPRWRGVGPALLNRKTV